VITPGEEAATLEEEAATQEEEEAATLEGEAATQEEEEAPEPPTPRWHHLCPQQTKTPAS
jgi:hypothetical protein